MRKEPKAVHLLFDGASELGPIVAAQDSFGPEYRCLPRRATPGAIGEVTIKHGDHFSFLAVAHSDSIEHSRKLLLANDDLGESGDGTCPERDKARRAVMEDTPAIWHGANSEFVLTDSAEVREREAYLEQKLARIDELERLLAAGAVASEGEYVLAMSPHLYHFLAFALDRWITADLNTGEAKCLLAALKRLKPIPPRPPVPSTKPLSPAAGLALPSTIAETSTSLSEEPSK